jgi:hypothetical protein
MDRNKPSSGIHFFVCLAVLTVSLLSGCTQALQEAKPSKNEMAANDRLQRAKKLFEEGNYEASFKENESVLSLADGKAPGDEALFNLGLITAHSKNPARDYPKALVFFERMVREYPQSRLIEQAKIWVEVLQEHQKVTQETKVLLQQKQALTQEKIALSREREKLNQSMEQSRKVDIEIEQKRRKARVK